jgi:enoyl-CoA hydratase/carnithine racemase
LIGHTEFVFPAAGADIAEMAEKSFADFYMDDFLSSWEEARKISKPIIAAVHGYVLGAGAGLAFGSDMVVAAESARFGYPELKAGLAATTVTAHAVHLMGRKVAFELLTLCENMLPQRAYELGMVNRVVPDDKLIDEAMAIAEKLAGWNLEQLTQTKRTFHRAVSLSPDQSLEMARDVSIMLGRFPK